MFVEDYCNKKHTTPKGVEYLPNKFAATNIGILRIRFQQFISFVKFGRQSINTHKMPNYSGINTAFQPSENKIGILRILITNSQISLIQQNESVTLW